jgi:hypothetical protein
MKRQMLTTTLARTLVAAGVLGLAVMAPAKVWAQASCGAGIDPTITQPTPSFVGDTASISLELQTGSLQGATAMTVNRVRYKLDCFDDGLFPLCTDEGSVLTFTNGTESTDCTAGGNPVAVDCELNAADPNIVDCDLTPDAVLPPNNATPCSVSFDTLIAGVSTDATVGVIEGAVTIDGSCDNALLASAQGTTAVFVATTTSTTTTSSTTTSSTTTSSTTTSSTTTSTTVPSLGACRVTGGGISDDTFPTVIKATHGGQVGASVGVATAFTPDSACIKGEWTHVRHVRKGLRGNFHGRSFDSLNCACLPCAESAGSGVVEDGLCNPDDRICGPEPRRAPDNAICFSGVGDYAMTKGRRARRTVVFRVDIQDHSEPGGQQGSEPPDRYRIRIWFLNGDDPASADAIALRMGVACAQAGVELLSVRDPDIDDGGDLIKGNHQIHPQIHPECTEPE